MASESYWIAWEAADQRRLGKVLSNDIRAHIERRGDEGQGELSREDWIAGALVTAVFEHPEIAPLALLSSITMRYDRSRQERYQFNYAGGLLRKA